MVRALLSVIGLSLSLTAFGKMALREQVRSLIGKPILKAVAIRIDEIDEDGLNALHHAAIMGDLPLVKFLLDNGVNPRHKDKNRRYPLDYIVAIPEKELNYQQMMIASYLTEATCGLNTDNGDYLLGKRGRYYTTLAWAMLAGDQQRVEELFDAGANPRISTVHNFPGNKDPQKNAFEIALSTGNQQLLAIVKNKMGDSLVPLAHKQMRIAVETTNHRMLEQLLDLVDVDEFFLGELLLLAAKERSVKNVDTLIANGAKVNVRNGDGDSPILIAASHRKSQVVETLIKHGANVNDFDAEGLPAILVAANAAKNYAGGTYTVKIFLEHGVDADTRDINNYSLASYGAHGREPEVVEWAIRYGGDINVRYIDPWGVNHHLLQWVIVADQGSMLQEWLENGVDPNTTIDKLNGYPETTDNTLLAVAVSYSRLQLIRLLLNAGADSSIKNSKGHTALDIAFKKLKKIKSKLKDRGNNQQEREREKLIEIISLLAG